MDDTNEADIQRAWDALGLEYTIVANFKLVLSVDLDLTNPQESYRHGQILNQTHLVRVYNPQGQELDQFDAPSEFEAIKWVSENYPGAKRGSPYD